MYVLIVHTCTCPLAGSHGFASAIADIKQRFPTGLFCHPCAITTDYDVSHRIQLHVCLRMCVHVMFVLGQNKSNA